MDGNHAMVGRPIGQKERQIGQFVARHGRAGTPQGDVQAIGANNFKLETTPIIRNKVQGAGICVGNALGCHDDFFEQHRHLALDGQGGADLIEFLEAAKQLVRVFHDVPAQSEFEKLIVLQHLWGKILKTRVDLFHGRFDLARLQMGNVNSAGTRQFLQIRSQFIRPIML